MDVDVAAVNLFLRLAMLTDNRLVPIVVLFDGRGDETEDPDLAIAGVAGTAALGWWPIHFLDWIKKPLH